MINYKDAIIGKYKNLSILIVEDDKTSIVKINEVFNELCQEFDIVTNEEEFTCLITSKIYDVVFVSMYIPNFNGLEGIKQKIRDSINKDTPVVELSSKIFVRDKTEISSTENIYSAIYRNAEIRMLDLKHISSITRGNNTRYKELTDLFFKRYRSIENFYNEKVGMNEFVVLKDYVHTLKGCAGVLGLFKIYRLALKIQYNVENIDLWYELFDSIGETEKYIIKKFEVR